MKVKLMYWLISVLWVTSLFVNYSCTGGQSSGIFTGSQQCTLTIVTGKIGIQIPGSTEWKDGSDGMSLNAGTRVKTPADGISLLTFPDKSTVEIDQNTELLIQKLESVGKGSNTVLKQFTGKTVSRAAELIEPGSSYEIQTPSAYALVRGTRFSVEVDELNNTLVKVLDKVVTVGAQDKTVPVEAGYQVEIRTGMPPSEPTPITGFDPAMKTSLVEILASIKNGPKKALPHPIMSYTPEEFAALDALDRSMPAAPIDKEAFNKIQANKSGGSHSLLEHIQYNTTDRDQGSCGNCWVWANTGMLEVALDVQRGIKKRLSTQYFNSTYNNGSGSSDYACCGGTTYKFVNHYKYTLKKAVPWSAANAEWADMNTCCCEIPCSTCSTVRPAGSIDSNSEHYDISSIGPVQVIPTHGSNSGSTAIANIKTYLDADKAVVFALRLPTGDHWELFQDWWEGRGAWSPIDTLQYPYFWNYTYLALGCGYNLDSGNGGHEMLCVGYNDDNTEQGSYWIMLNSWGDANGLRPDGLIRMPMYYNYDCMVAAGEYITEWYTYPVTFETATPCPVTCNNCITESEAASSGNYQKCSTSPCGFAADGSTKKYCYRESIPQPVPPVASIEYFTVNRKQVSPGEQVVLNWAVSGQGEVILTCDGQQRSVPSTGSTAITPKQSGCCTLTVGDKETGDRGSVCVTVSQTKVAKPVINSFTAVCSPKGPEAPGVCRLSWTVSGPAGTTVNIQPGIGSVGLSGTREVAHGGLYTLTATSQGGTVTSTASVN